MPNSVYIAVSLDGFIAGTNGELDWLNNWPNPDQADYGYAEFMGEIDALVMGRRTFETVLGFGGWPYDKPVFVLSATLGAVPAALADRVTLLSGPPEDVLRVVHQRGHHSLYIDGGQTIQSFLRADLIDSLIITSVPILLGEGIPLFGPLDQPLKLTHQHTATFASGLVQSHYVQDKAAAR